MIDILVISVTAKAIGSDIETGVHECPSLPDEASAELISAYEKGRKAFVKDDSMAQPILVGNIYGSSDELAATCHNAESVWESSLPVYEKN
ncbi:hypothetical protein AVEN_71736-1 [Araneus ventricosus]|uniref:Uncharacterized protein n=1 Tax=Araneus ventricosus TaxID=182803 RepID=A0A4Y2B2F1_ARAVE|nr:hypothetical protein AVEN_71736-1 [Araneus ventricosus]